MPTYVYEVILEDGEPGHRFEVEQRMTDPPLVKHPTTGQPVRRVILPPHIVSDYSETGMQRKMNDEKKLDQLGFTKYVKSGDGTYEKRSGKGPDVIQK